MRNFNIAERPGVTSRPMPPGAAVGVVPGKQELIAGSHERRFARVTIKVDPPRTIANRIIEDRGIRQFGGAGHVDRIAPGEAIVS